ncbi:hypothetical protein HDU97_002200 [Phlyctochytrium planicorne]|nr:hypothetical protein HDU97_002200 [Phlyctochytrium planicorne]
MRSHLTRDDLVKQFGGIYKLRAMSREAIFIADPASAKKILTLDGFKKPGRALSLLSDYFKYVLFLMPTNDEWRRHRKFMLSSFGPAHQRQTLDVTIDICDQLAQMWKGRIQSGGSPVTNIHHVMSCLGIDVIGQIAFSYDFRSILEHENMESSTKMKAFNALVSLVGTRPYMPKFLWSLYGVGTGAKQDEVNLIKGIVARVIAAKRERGADAVGEAQKDILDRLLETSGWTDQEVNDELIALFLAGSETTANTLVFIIFLLDKYPDVLRRLEEELREVLDGASSGKLTWDLLPKLKYTEAIIKETLRLHPTLPIINSRISAQDMELSGHMVAANTPLIIDIRGIHRNPDVYERPLNFEPERWLSGFVPPPGAYIPFGDGPHICLGMKMAMTEMKTVLACLIPKFRFKVVPDQDLEPVTSLTYGFKNGLKVQVEERT